VNKILIVSSGNSLTSGSFVSEQVESLNSAGIHTSRYTIKGKGLFGYLRNLPKFYKTIHINKPYLIHAHYGLSGLFASLQFKVPVVVTYHGSDVNEWKNRQFSRVASKLCAANIFVSKNMMELMPAKNSFHVPCGLNTSVFKPHEYYTARKRFGMSDDVKYILFSSSFTNKVKNYPLAKNAVKLLDRNKIKLLELKGYSRREVASLLSAVDLALMTSHSEGSPQFIKEAMACNTPIVSTNVGDVKESFGPIKGCYITGSTPAEVAKNIRIALNLNSRTVARDAVLNLDADLVAKKVLAVYKQVLFRNKSRLHDTGLTETGN
jgi:teichuronic acid biosynthesis glycosyltransferase TuaC